MNESNESGMAKCSVRQWFVDVQAHMRSIGKLLEEPALREGRVSPMAWARVCAAFANLHEAADECDAALFAAGLERLA